MKGIVFTLFNDMVEEKFGIEVWNQLIDKVKPRSDGVYTAGKTYDDAELLALVNGLSEIINIKKADLIEAYGIYMFPVLAKKYPVFIKEGMSLKDFLKSVDQIIHVEVLKLYPEASLPSITCEDPSSNKLIMLYRSPRKLCALALGLVRGAADHMNTSVQVKQTICMHQGADHCRLEINIG